MVASDVVPDLLSFRALAADRRVVPVTRRLLADGETPVGLYRKLAGDRSGTFLLESAEHGGVWSRYSFIGARSAAVLTERDGTAAWLGTVPAGLPVDGEPLDVLQETLARLRTPRDEATYTEAYGSAPPSLTGGLIGYLSYDVVRRFERLPDLAEDDLQIPELAMMLATDLAVLDHTDGSVLLIANAVNWDDSAGRVDEAYADAVSRLDRMTEDLLAPLPGSAVVLGPQRQEEAGYSRQTTAEDYRDAVAHAQEEIRAGEAFQVVLSQRFTMPDAPDSLDVYRMLRLTNPSPYMYLLRLPALAEGAAPFDIVGSSPEALVKVTGDRVLTRPIAGTRPRGETPEEDATLAEQLLADEKERAEHLMLVDLGRNDLGRVSTPGTVEVVQFMEVERYSHVMHLVSTVVGRLAEGRSAFDALRAAFPAGTLSGAPKPRAMEIIEQLEPTRRGLYGGVVGYLDFAGDLDAAIAIRTALLRDGVAYVQAGAGIVADSDPEAEDTECRNKAAAVLRAVAMARRLS